MNYRVILSRSARKQMERISGEIENRILDKLSELEMNPRPSGCKSSKTATPGAFAWATTG